MPNHVFNELVFREVARERQSYIIDKLCNRKGEVDFEILVPLPLNVWWGSVSSKHEATFKRTALDWSKDNWGTKWNAYSHRQIERTDDTVIFRFETAWNPPYPWLAAVMNSLKCQFEHNWISEFDNKGRVGRFNFSALAILMGNAWSEELSDDAEHKRLHKLKWGVEKFSDEEVEP